MNSAAAPGRAAVDRQTSLRELIGMPYKSTPCQEARLFPSRVVNCIGFLLLALVPSFAAAQQFSAELVRIKPEGAANSRVFVSGGKMRLASAGQEDGIALLVSLVEGTGLMILPSKSYVPFDLGRAPSPMLFFRAADVGNACPEWENKVGKPGTCTKVGEETVGGRSTLKYKGTAPNGDTGYAWIDHRFHDVIKWEGQVTAFELKNIKEGPQAASLFGVPADYQKMQTAQARKAKAAPVVKPKP
jgi:hypothetical protein